MAFKSVELERELLLGPKPMWNTESTPNVATSRIQIFRGSNRSPCANFFLFRKDMALFYIFMTILHLFFTLCALQTNEKKREVVGRCSFSLYILSRMSPLFVVKLIHKFWHRLSYATNMAPFPTSC